MEATDKPWDKTRDKTRDNNGDGVADGSPARSISDRQRKECTRAARTS